MENIENKGYQATKQQISEWKKKFGDVNEVTVEDKCCYLKPITRTVISLATHNAQSDSMAFAETVLENCWLAGDEEIKNDDRYFLGVNTIIGEMVEIKKATLKKL